MRRFLIRNVVVVAAGFALCLAASAVCAAPVTLKFQQGVNILMNGADTGVLYTGAVDTEINTSQGTPNSAPLNTQVSMQVKEYAGFTQYYRALLEFNGIFGGGATQIPTGSTITSASLTLTHGSELRGNGSSATTGLYRMVMSWAPTVTWAADFGGNGIDMNGVEAATTATAQFPGFLRSYVYETATRDVTTDLAAWVASPASNYGWVLKTAHTANQSCYLNTSDYAGASGTAARPSLEVTFEPGSGNQTTAVPEPAALGLFGVVLLTMRKRRS